MKHDSIQTAFIKLAKEKEVEIPKNFQLPTEEEFQKIEEEAETKVTFDDFLEKFYWKQGFLEGYLLGVLRTITAPQ